MYISTWLHRRNDFLPWDTLPWGFFAARTPNRRYIFREDSLPQGIFAVGLFWCRKFCHGTFHRKRFHRRYILPWAHFAVGTCNRATFCAEMYWRCKVLATRCFGAKTVWRRRFTAELYDVGTRCRRDILAPSKFQRGSLMTLMYFSSKFVTWIPYLYM